METNVKTMNVIDLQNLSWNRQEKPVLSNVDWQVKKGEHWAILGLNGSGKTTLLNMINGYIWPSTGHVTVLEQRFGTTDLRELRKSIGWVSSSLQERIKQTTIAEDIVVSGKHATIGIYDETTEEDYERAIQLLEQLGASHLIGRMYQTCSQGEKQKILIARGLMGSPEILILDEPTNGLDFISREELLETVQNMGTSENAPTILLVTHHIEEILPVFSHTLLLRKGTVFSKGRTENVLTSESLTAFFDLPVEITWKNSRAWMSMK